MAKDTKNGFYYPPDIKLKFNPLVEAWLTIQWEIKQTQPKAPTATDPGFTFNFIQGFFEKVREQYSHLVELEDISKIPIEISPFKPRYQFRQGENGWPLLQLGPGIATLNFTEPYTWDDFKKEALDLPPNLIAAYGEHELKPSLISLRYRNATPCDYSSTNLLEFLQGKLNTTLQLPGPIPGNASSTKRPSIFNLALTYDLREPAGKGILRITTGMKKEEDQPEEEHIIFETEVVSREENAPSIEDREAFSGWLTSAHSITHDWFFSLIDGELREKYERGEDP